MSCPICSSHRFRKLKQYRNQDSFFDKKNICECEICKMQFIHPMPLKDKWEKYNSNYFLNAHGGTDVSPWIYSYNMGVAKVRFKVLSDYILKNNIDVKSILEVGPGSGYLLTVWKEKYPNSKYYVVESDNSVYNKLESLGAIIIDSDNISNIGKVDLIISTHVLEHTIKPIDFLSHFCSVLRKGGGVFIETPCQDHLYKKFHEPHLQFFDKNNLLDCFKAIGLENVLFSYNGDRIKNLIWISCIKKIFVKIEKVTTFPFHTFLGRVWPNRLEFGLTNMEALAIVETSPHIEHNFKSRWVRAFGQKGIK